MEKSVLKANNLTKDFNGFLAVDNISFEITKTAVNKKRPSNVVSFPETQHYFSNFKKSAIDISLSLNSFFRRPRPMVLWSGIVSGFL